MSENNNLLDSTTSLSGSQSPPPTQLTHHQKRKIRLFSGNSHPQLATEICSALQNSQANGYVEYFSNGECRPVIKTSVRSKQVFVLMTGVSNAKHSINDYLMETYLMCCTLKRADCKKITLLLPFYPYARQDKKDSARAGISASDIAQMIEVSGVSRVVCLDLHAAAIQGFFKIPVDNLYAISPAIEYLRSHVFSKHPKDHPSEHFIAVSPDEGAFKRTRIYAEECQIPYVGLSKTRDYSKRNTLDPTKTQIFGSDIMQLRGKTAIIFDDMCDTFGTIQNASRKLKEEGAKNVIVLVTHGILSGPALSRLTETEEVTQFICSDSLPLSPEALAHPKIKTFSIAPLYAEVVRRLVSGESISAVFQHS